MSTFYFHVRDGNEELLDPEGTELTDIEAIATRSLKEARAGRVKLHQRIDVEDAAGALIHSLPFASAVEIV